MRTLLLSITLLAAVSTTGCYTHRYNVGSGGNTAGEETYSKWGHHFVFGIIGESNVDVRQVCPSGNATIKDEMSFVNGLIAVFIGIIYAPTTVTVWCDLGGGGNPDVASKQGREITLTLGPADLRAIAESPALIEYVRSRAPEKVSELRAALDQFEQRSAEIAAIRAMQM